MGALVLAQGAHGALVRRLQQHLVDSSLVTGGVDGSYGAQTTVAVRAAQARRGLTATGSADPATWTAITGDPVPSLLDRALQLTAAFEGHGFGLAKGNFDGAGITWGIIGFTLRHGEVGRIIQEAQQQDPALVSNAFGADAEELLRLLTLPMSDQLSWADQHSIGTLRGGLMEPWRTHFQAFGDQPAVQAIQLRHVAQNYFQPATATAARYGLKSELGLTLCFDIHVQDGGINPKAAAAISAQLDPGAPEPDRRVLIAKSVAALARPEYRADVEARKLTIASGTGSVHGVVYTLANWGLDESPE
jgi:peptidoglycan hydrolase-like protein with peptidoglycan-binding domain